MKLRLEKIKKTYANGAMAVKDIDLAIADGQMTVLLGPSGCGKTTLLRLICGLEQPDDGAIYLDGTDITDWEPRQRDVAMVFQNYALYPHMTVRQNLEFGLKSRKIPAPELKSAVKWAAGLLGLENMLDRKPKELSGGQRQRVALGRAIVRKPKLFLFDEPLSNLDAELRMKMRGEILGLHKRLGGTSIYVTHDQVEAMSLADIIYLMKDGEIVANGPPAELYKNPPDLFTAGFLGFPAMNLIRGSLDSGVFISEKGMKIPLDLSASEQSGQVVLGIRPEDLVADDTGQVKGTVNSLENLGRATLLNVKTESGDEFRMVVEREIHIGAKISARIILEKSLIFSSDSGLLIS